MKKKHMADARMSLSSQSDFSSAVIICFDVPMTFVSTSWADDVELRLAVDASTHKSARRHEYKSKKDT